MVEVMLHDRQTTFPCCLACLLDAFDAAASIVDLMREGLVDGALRRFHVAALKTELPHVRWHRR